MATNNQYVISDVEALWPRINKTYKFDNAENRTVACDPFDDGAKYETRFRMTKDQLIYFRLVAYFASFRS